MALLTLRIVKNNNRGAWWAQSLELATLDLKLVNSSPDPCVCRDYLKTSKQKQGLPEKCWKSHLHWDPGSGEECEAFRVYRAWMAGGLSFRVRLGRRGPGLKQYGERLEFDSR